MLLKRRPEPIVEMKEKMLAGVAAEVLDEDEELVVLKKMTNVSNATRKVIGKPAFTIKHSHFILKLAKKCALFNHFCIFDNFRARDCPEKRKTDDKCFKCGLRGHK